MVAVNNIKMDFIELIRGKLKEGVEVERDRGEQGKRWWSEGIQKKGEKDIEKQIPAKDYEMQ